MCTSLYFAITATLTIIDIENVMNRKTTINILAVTPINPHI